MLILIAAANSGRSQSVSVTPASQIWGAIHGVFLLLGTVAVMIGFVAGLMYLLHAYRLKHKLVPMRGFQLPSLEWLEKVNGRAILISIFALAIGVLSGTVLNVVNHGRAVERGPLDRSGRDHVESDLWLALGGVDLCRRVQAGRQGAR